jgi:hypothetical protein
MPEPVLVAISAALAGKAVTSLYDFVRTKLAARREAVAALEAAEGAAENSLEVQTLATELEKAEQADPVFGRQLREQWQTLVQQASQGNVNLNISGDLSNAKVVQTHNLHGDITFN